MPIHHRLALPWIATTVLLLAGGMAGASWYAGQAARAVLDHERAQFVGIMHNRIRDRGRALGEIATILGTLEGPVRERLAAWSHLPVDAAAVLDPRSGAFRSRHGPALDAADLRAALAQAGGTAAGPQLVRGGGALYLAAFERAGPAEAVCAAIRLDGGFARELEQLLGGALRIELDRPPRDAGADELVAALELPTAGGTIARISLVLPAGDLAVARRRAVNAAAAVGALLLAASIAFYAWTLARVTRPLTGLIEAAHRIADGRLDTRMPADAPAELGRLISAFNEMARRLAQAEERVVRASKLSALGTVVAGISHELNNPLSIILSHAELRLERMGGNAPGRAELEIVLAEGGRMKRILADLRGLLRAADPVRVRVDLGRVAEDVHRLVAPEAIKARVESTLQPPITGVGVVASPDEVRQVVLNLALNALQAMPGGGTLRISTTVTGVNGGRLARVAVEDSGEGLSPAARDAVFEPFHTTRPGRLGLGLAISRDIARRHGGDVRLLPRDAGGTTAVLELPAEPG